MRKLQAHTCTYIHATVLRGRLRVNAHIIYARNILYILNHFDRMIGYLFPKITFFPITARTESSSPYTILELIFIISSFAFSDTVVFLFSTRAEGLHSLLFFISILSYNDFYFRFFKMSTPPLNNIMIFGAIMAYIYVPVHGIKQCKMEVTVINSSLCKV